MKFKHNHRSPPTNLDLQKNFVNCWIYKCSLKYIILYPSLGGTAFPN